MINKKFSKVESYCDCIRDSKNIKDTKCQFENLIPDEYKEKIKVMQI